MTLFRTDPDNYKTFQVAVLFTISKLYARISQVLTGKSQFQMQLRSQSSQDEEEVDYGSSSLEELYHQEGSQDFDWDLDCFVHV